MELCLLLKKVPFSMFFLYDHDHTSGSKWPLGIGQDTFLNLYDKNICMSLKLDVKSLLEMYLIKCSVHTGRIAEEQILFSNMASTSHDSN